MQCIKQQTSTTCSKSTMPSEHRYATVGQNFERESELFDPRFGLIKSAWNNLYEDKENAHQPVPLIRFLEVRNQSKALLSRTTIVASVLFKYREANALASSHMTHWWSMQIFLLKSYRRWKTGLNFCLYFVFQKISVDYFLSYQSVIKCDSTFLNCEYTCSYF